jgi:NAD(P)-dependent dehydrogenase (short-subunit alcohol dehydrogenase family)
MYASNSSMNNAATRTILVTGLSTGLGKALASEALAQGWRVVGTVRKEEDRKQFESQDPHRAFGRLLDLRDTARTAPLVAEIEQAVGPIDVLVSNAGYGLMSPIEEASLDQVRAQFEVNVFGQLAMLQAVLPGMRYRRKGHILNITSMGGLVAFPNVGIYSATKFAMEGITEALRQEVSEFNIQVTAVEPGMFKTDWAGRSLQTSVNKIADYDGFRKRMAERELNWNGDLQRGVQAMLRIAEMPDPPSYLLLGSIANQLVEDKIERLSSDIDRFRALSVWTDIDAPGAFDEQVR